MHSQQRHRRFLTRLNPISASVSHVIMTPAARVTGSFNTTDSLQNGLNFIKARINRKKRCHEKKQSWISKREQQSQVQPRFELFARLWDHLIVRFSHHHHHHPSPSLSHRPSTLLIPLDHTHSRLSSLFVVWKLSHHHYRFASYAIKRICSHTYT